ncbi:MAG: hypothetical protein QM763_24855 [Agriterribacter sp.]
MKKLLLFSGVLFAMKAKSQTLKDSLLAINYTYYFNKPIDSLLQALPHSYDSIYTSAGSSAFVGATVIVNYGNMRPTVCIYPGTHNYYTPLNAAQNPPHIAWPLNLVRKENTWMIVLFSFDAGDPWPLQEICCGN